MELPAGIRQTPKGFQAYVWVKDPTKPKGGFQASKRFGPDTSFAEMKAWRNKRRYDHPDTLPTEGTTFAEDARDYLRRPKVQMMPTKDERIRHTQEWIALFGNRSRRDIQPHDIQHALEQMRARMSAGSVNKRRTALMDLWTTLDGRHQANPVKATKAYEEPHPEPRAPSLATVLKILKAMPTTTDYARKCKARVQVIAWTGWPHAIVKTLQHEDAAHWKRGEAFITRRKKGKGARARWLPLLPEAQKALAYFKQVQAFGDFSNSTLHKRVTATCKALKIEPIRPYDLRHFFLTLIAVTTRDERAVMELGLISSPEIARRYTEAATDPRVQAAVKQVAGKLPRLKIQAGRIGRKSRQSASKAVQTRPRNTKDSGANP